MEFSNQMQFFDLNSRKKDSTAFFFLENVLKARIDLDLPTGRRDDSDEDTNVYMAGLLTSALSSGESFRTKPYLSPYDIDIQQYLNQHPGRSNQFIVYKDNADFGLVNISIFWGHDHRGSYHKKVMANVDETGRVALYYTMAAHALEHINGHRTLLVHTFHNISEHMDEIIRIMRKVSGEYFDFVAKISEGSFFHLEREVDALVKYAEYKRKLDDFLLKLASFRKEPTAESRAELTAMVKILKELNPEFAFDESVLQPEKREESDSRGSLLSAS